MRNRGRPQSLAVDEKERRRQSVKLSKKTKQIIKADHLSKKEVAALIKEKNDPTKKAEREELQFIWKMETLIEIIGRKISPMFFDESFSVTRAHYRRKGEQDGDISVVYTVDNKVRKFFSIPWKRATLVRTSNKQLANSFKGLFMLRLAQANQKEQA